jgi:polar amino acid transport system substrate-binding protein
MFRLFCVWLAGIVFASTALAGEPDIVVLYRDKPPYFYTQDGRPKGFLLERTMEVFKRAGLRAKFEEAPVKRITMLIQSSPTPVCSPGWYKLPEREEYARFSQEIHEDKPHLVMVGSHAVDKVRAATSLRQVLANPQLKVGKVSGVSYGAELDAMMAGAAQVPMDSTVSPLGMANMIKAGRADYMFIDEEDYKYLNVHGDVDAQGVVPVRFGDMPAGLKRYIMCSKSVSPKTMARLDRAIARVMRP